MKSKNPSFSVRALAAKLGMQPSATNEILKGQRRVSKKIAERIADKLQLDPSERTDLLKDFSEVLKRKKDGRKVREKDLDALRLNSNQFELISDWIHFAILSLIRVKNFQSDISWMANRLEVSEVEVRKALFRLQALSLVNIDKDGLITRTPHPVRTTDDVYSLCLQYMHVNDMEIAKNKIAQVHVSKRDFTSYTFPANPKLIARAKEIIRKAQDDLEDLMNDDSASEVYKVCMYLFPLTNIIENHKEE